ncbi:MAG: hypothetical protein QXP76_01690, partial [Acidilobaceae archaeon]
YVNDKRVRENWGQAVVAKINVFKVIEKEIKKISKSSICVSTITDPYQPIESVFKLTRRSLEILLSRGFRVSVQTKNPMVLRDLDLIEAHRKLVDVGFTITTVDRKVASFIEPHAPPPKARINALEELAKRGVTTWVFYGPIIPEINDDLATVEAVTEIAVRTRSILYFDPLRVKPFMFEEHHPLREYALKARNKAWLENVINTMRKVCAEKKIECRTGFSAEPLD